VIGDGWWRRISRTNRQVWPSTVLTAGVRRGRYQGYFHRASGEVARRFMTHHEALPEDFGAMQHVRCAANPDL